MSRNETPEMTRATADAAAESGAATPRPGPADGSPLAPLLAIETATPTTRVALVDARTGALLATASASVAPSERHSSNLLRLCVEVMEARGVAVPGLAGIACDAGPGSFTGLRVGLAVAKGLALPTAIPLVTVSSLEILARDWLAAAGAPGAPAGDPRPLRLVPCLDAGKGQLFAAVFSVDAARADVTEVAGTVSVVPGALASALGLADPGDPVILFGPGADRFAGELRAALGPAAALATVVGPTAESLARCACSRLASGARDDLATVVPSYGRAPDITRPKPPVR
jgi:tRNA threonylcarbamoyladenosine biosynthesis protein TsaB